MKMKKIRKYGKIRKIIKHSQIRTIIKYAKLDGRKRVIRYEIQAQKLCNFIDGLDCCQKLVTCGFVNCGVWFFSFYLRTKHGIVDPPCRFRFKDIHTPKSFNIIHHSRFLPF